MMEIKLSICKVKNSCFNYLSNIQRGKHQRKLKLQHKEEKKSLGSATFLQQTRYSQTHAQVSLKLYFLKYCNFMDDKIINNVVTSLWHTLIHPAYLSYLYTSYLLLWGFNEEKSINCKPGN